MLKSAPVPRSRAATRQAWSERLARFALSRQSAARFGATEGVSVASLYLWKRRLSAATASDAPRLLPVSLTSSPSPLELLLPTGAVLRIGTGADPDTLAALLRLLGVPPC